MSPRERFADNDRLARFLAGKLYRRSWSASLDYEDALQEAYVALWRAAHSYDEGCGVPFGPYASACIRRQVRDVARRSAALHPLSLDAFPDELGAAPDPSAARRMEEVEREDQIETLLSSVPARERKALRDALSGAGASWRLKRDALARLERIVARTKEGVCS